MGVSLRPLSVRNRVTHQECLLGEGGESLGWVVEERDDEHRLGLLESAAAVGAGANLVHFHFSGWD